MNLIKTLYSLMDADDRRSFLIYVLISFLAGVIEVIGIGSIMPFIAVLMQPDMIMHNQILLKIYNGLQFQDTKQFLVFMGCTTLVVLITGGMINIFSVRYQLIMSYRIGHKWALKLFSSYLNQPYRFYLEENSNAMKSGILSEVDRVVSSILNPSAVMISKIMIITVIFLLLLFVNPVVTILLMALTGGIYAGLLYYFRHKMRIKGQEGVIQNKIRFQTISEAFSSIRDVKLYDNAGFFEGKFGYASKVYNDSQAYNLYHGQIPRFIIEMTGFVALISLMLYLIVVGKAEMSAIIPLVALFAASGYKVLPAAQNLYAAMNSIRYNTAALDIVAKGINLAPSPHHKHDPDNPGLVFMKEIEVRHIDFSYAQGGRSVLKDIHCTIKKNSLVGVVGPTGAGKSTFIDILIGLLAPENGEILVDGQRIDESNIQLWQRQIGYVPQKIYLLEGSIESNIAFGNDQADHSRIVEAATNAQINSYVDSLADGYKTSVGEHGDRLSGGQRQRIGIARALYRNPEVLVLDEPTSALDIETARNLMGTLKTLSRQKTVIAITHSMEVLEYCDQVLFLDSGQLQATENFESLINHNARFATLVKKA